MIYPFQEIEQFWCLFELFLAALIGLFFLEKKNFFVHRLLGYSFLYVFVAIVSSLTVEHIMISEIAKKNIVFFLSIIILLVFARGCFSGKFSALVFLIHFGYMLFMISNGLFKVLSIVIVNSDVSFHMAVWCIFRLLIVCLVYTVGYLMFRKVFRGDIERCVSKDLLGFCATFILTSLILSYVGTLIQNFKPNWRLTLMGCELAYVFIMHLIQYALINQIQVDNELHIIKALWEQDRKRYELQKENMEIVNIKCHDLRHQIQTIRKSGTIGEQMIDEIEKVVKVYDSNISTDNEVLDVILSDMALRCQCNDIQFTCMVDGKQLSFMEEVDVYSLMGNMLENAFEYECKVQPSSDRFISVVIREIAEGVSIHVENYYIGDAVVENGIVETTKEDKNFHGFGMLSMKKHVEKYAGRLEVMIEDEMFQVDILIPKTDKEEP